MGDRGGGTYGGECWAALLRVRMRNLDAHQTEAKSIATSSILQKQLGGIRIMDIVDIVTAANLPSNNSYNKACVYGGEDLRLTHTYHDLLAPVLFQKRIQKLKSPPFRTYHIPLLQSLDSRRVL